MFRYIMKLEYTKDICGNDILQSKNGTHDIMMEWEKPYMEKCIEYLEPSGTILEIGFGMGYSAEKIVSFDSVTSYTVIECSPQVWEKYEIFKEKMRQTRPDLNINIIKGRWEDVLCLAGTYDRIFMTTTILKTLTKMKEHLNKFIHECLIDSHVNSGTMISYYSLSNHSYTVPCIDCSMNTYIPSIPSHRIEKYTILYIPLLTINEKYNSDKIPRLLVSPNDTPIFNDNNEIEINLNSTHTNEPSTTNENKKNPLLFVDKMKYDIFSSLAKQLESKLGEENNNVGFDKEVFMKKMKEKMERMKM